jgi:hypothetical protein
LKDAQTMLLEVIVITFVTKEEHEEKWELGQHFPKVSYGEC